jgi:osmotically-inducible protein OsmY
MSVTLKKELLIVALACGAGGFGLRVEAQSAPALDQSDMRVVSALVDSSAAKSEKLRSRVMTAMHVDPYLLDEHIEVAVVENAIVLRGFVLSAWDLREAVRVARKVAGDTRVLDELSIKEGGS